MRYDEDDLYEYSDGSFDEGEAIDEVIDTLKPDISVTEAQAEAELDKVDWDIDAAVANLRKRYAKPKQAPQKPASSASDAKGKLTPLQLLAQRRKQAQSSDSSPPEVPQSTNNDSSGNEPPQKELTGLAKLASLRRAKSSTPESGNENAPTSAPEKPLSALEKLKLRKLGASNKNDNKSNKNGTNDKNNDNNNNNNSGISGSSVTSAIPSQAANNGKNWSPIVDYENMKIEFTSINEPSSFGAVIGTAASPHNRNFITNSLATAKSASSAFNKPSPDDVVLKAQEGAFTKHGAQKSAGTNSGANSAGPTSKQNSPAPTSTPAPKPKVAAVNKDSLISRISGLSLKHSCSFVVIGHVDAGKSTLMGRLLHDTGALSAKTVQKFEHESNKAGKSSFWLAWALDSTDEERSRGVTVDIGEASFETADTRFTVLDAPGHKDYVPNMIAGVAQADLAVLVVDADTNAFESGFSLDGQTKEHAVLARSLGLERVIVAVNKLDTQNWSEDRFEDIKVQMNEFLTKKVGYNLDQLFYVPTSGIAGVNIVKTGQEKACSWYTGPSLVGSLENFVHSRTTKDAVKQPLRFLVSNSFVEPFQSNLTLTGRVLTGCLEAGDPVEIVGLKETAKVKSMDREFLVAGEPGEIKLALDNLKLDDGPVNVRPGDVVAGAGANLKPVTKFIAKIRLFDIPRPILPGTKLSFHLGRVDDMVTVTKIIESLATSTKKSAAPARKLRHLGKGAAARVELELASPAILSTTDVCKDLGRFVLRLNGSTVGGGVVESIENV